MIAQVIKIVVIAFMNEMVMITFVHNVAMITLVHKVEMITHLHEMVMTIPILYCWKIISTRWNTAYSFINKYINHLKYTSIYVIFPDLENDSFQPGHAAPTIASSFESMKIWLDWGLNYLQANLTPAWLYNLNKKAHSSNNAALKTMKFLNAIFLPFCTWGSNFVLFVISKRLNLKSGLRH